MESYQLNDDVTSDFKYFPTLNIDMEAGIAELSGRCFPEDEASIYEQLEHYSTPCVEKGKFHLSFKVEYFNTSAAKAFFNWFKYLKDFYEKGADIKVIWYFYEFDENMEEAGLEYQELIDLPFIFIPNE